LKLLFIDACIRGKDSRTLEIAKYYIEKTKEKLGCETEIKRLYEEKLLPYYAEDIEKRNKLIENGEFENEFFSDARSFALADIIIIAAPYWDLAFPSALKIYFEHVSALGIAFKYDDSGRAIGLLKAKKAVYITTSGGYIGNENHGYNYVSSLFKLLYGVNETDFISTEALDIYPQKVPQMLEDTKRKIDKMIQGLL